MHKRLASIVFVIAIIIIGFNNCGDGFQTINSKTINLESKLTLAFDIITTPQPFTNRVDEKINYQIKNLQASDKVTCKLNNIELRSCTSPIELNSLAQGAQRLELIVNNNTCNDCSYIINWLVDTNPPEIITVQAPDISTTKNEAEFEFSFSEEIHELSCKLNGTSLASCNNPLTLNNLEISNHTLELTAKDRAGNTSTEQFNWSVIDDTASAIMAFEFSESGVGSIKLAENTEQDIVFTVNVSIDAPIQEFLKVLYQEPTLPIIGNLDVTISAGTNEKTFNFSDLLSPITNLNGSIPEKVNIRAKITNKATQITAESFTKNIEINGKANAIKAAFSTNHLGFFIRNDNKIYTTFSKFGLISTDNKICDTQNINFKAGQVPIMIANGGQYFAGILTNDNELITYNCTINKLMNRVNIPQNIKVKNMVASYNRVFITSEDNKVYEYVVRTSDNTTSKITQIFQDVKIKTFAASFGVDGGSPMIGGYLIIDTDNNINYYNMHKIDTKVPVELPAGSEVSSFANEHRYINMLLTNGNALNYIIDSNFKQKKEVTKVEHFISSDSYCLVGINEVRRLNHFECPRSELKIIRNVSRDPDLYWAVGGTIGPE